MSSDAIASRFRPHEVGLAKPPRGANLQGSMPSAHWQSTPHAWLPLLAAIAAGATAFQVWPHRSRPGAVWLLLMLIAAAWWSALTVLEYCALPLAAKVLWSQISYLGIELAPLAAWRFTYSYTRGGANPPQPWRGLVDAWAVFIVLAAFTNAWHRMLWPATGLIAVDGYVHGWYARGPLFWANVVYCYGAMALSAAMFLRYALAHTGVLRRQGLVLFLAILMPWLTSALYLLRLGAWGRMDHTPVGFAVSGLLVAWGLWRLKLLRVLPVAAQTLFDHMVDPVLVLDHRGCLVLANPAAQAQFGLGEPTGEEPLSHRLSARPALVAALERPGAEQTVADADVWWDIRVTIMRNSGHRLCVLRDITERQRAVEATEIARRDADRSAREARTANAAKSTFLAQVSHDLRTPLHAILGLSELWRNADAPETVRSAAVTIHDAGEALLRLVNDLLDLSRIEAGKLELAVEPFALADALDHVWRLLGVVARHKGLQLDLQVAPDVPPRWMGDIDRLQQILINLVGNAVKFTESGRVAVRVAAPAGRLCIEVEDTGPGIAAERLATIFDPFTRGDLAQARRTQGTGLGLAIVRRLAEAMHGGVSVRSTVGRGSCFTLELPLPVAASAAPARSDAPAAPRDRPDAPCRVLLADDDTISRSVTRLQLEKCGCTVTTVNDGPAVLPAARSAVFDVILLDGQMPGLDGWDVAARLDSDPAPETGRPRIVGLSADLSPETLARWHRAGVAVVIAKPAGLRELQQAVVGGR